MRARLLFFFGLLGGYVLGARAGRSKYVQIKTQASRTWEDPRVQKVVNDTQDFVKENAPVVAERVSEGAKVAADSVATGAHAAAEAVKAASEKVSETTRIANTSLGEGTRAATAGAKDAAARVAETAKDLSEKLTETVRDLADKVGGVLPGGSPSDSSDSSDDTSVDDDSVFGDVSDAPPLHSSEPLAGPVDTAAAPDLDPEVGGVTDPEELIIVTTVDADGTVIVDTAGDIPEPGDDNAGTGMTVTPPAHRAE